MRKLILPILFIFHSINAVNYTNPSYIGIITVALKSHRYQARQAPDLLVPVVLPEPSDEIHQSIFFGALANWATMAGAAAINYMLGVNIVALHSDAVKKELEARYPSIHTHDPQSQKEGSSIYDQKSHEHSFVSSVDSHRSVNMSNGYHGDRKIHMGNGIYRNATIEEQAFFGTADRYNAVGMRNGLYPVMRQESPQEYDERYDFSKIIYDANGPIVEVDGYTIYEVEQDLSATHGSQIKRIRQVPSDEAFIDPSGSFIQFKKKQTPPQKNDRNDGPGGPNGPQQPQDPQGSQKDPNNKDSDPKPLPKGYFRKQFQEGIEEFKFQMRDTRDNLGKYTVHAAIDGGKSLIVAGSGAGAYHLYTTARNVSSGSNATAPVEAQKAVAQETYFAPFVSPAPVAPVPESSSSDSSSSSPSYVNYGPALHMSTPDRQARPTVANVSNRGGVTTIHAVTDCSPARIAPAAPASPAPTLSARPVVSLSAAPLPTSRPVSSLTIAPAASNRSAPSSSMPSAISSPMPAASNRPAAAPTSIASSKPAAPVAPTPAANSRPVSSPAPAASNRPAAPAAPAPARAASSNRSATYANVSISMGSGQAVSRPISRGR